MDEFELPGPEGVVPRVFLSYRHRDQAVVVELAERLRADLGSRNVFRDKDDLIGGEDWREELRRRVAAADCVLALIGAHWEGVRSDGTRRIDDADDAVRTELQQAIEERAAPTPVVVDRAIPDRVPRSLEPLFDAHAVAVTSSTLDAEPGSDYPRVLAAVWQSLRASVPGGVVVVADRRAELQLEEFVRSLHEANLVDARFLSRFGSNMCVVSARTARRRARQWPDAIVLVGDRDASAFLTDVTRALDEHPGFRRVAVVGAGAAALAGTGATIAHSAPTSFVSSMSGGAGMWATVATAVGAAAPMTKVAAVVAVVGLAAVGGVATGVIDIGGDGPTAVTTETAVVTDAPVGTEAPIETTPTIDTGLPVATDPVETDAPPPETDPPPTTAPEPTTTTSVPDAAAPPANAFVVTDTELVEVDVARNLAVRVVSESFNGDGVFRDGVVVTPDRASAYYGERYEDFWFSCESSVGAVGRVDLERGAVEMVATGSQPALDRSGRRLAYLSSVVCVPDPENPEFWVLTPADRVVVESGRSEVAFVTSPTPDSYAAPSALTWAGFDGDDLLVLTVAGDVHRVGTGGSIVIQEHPRVLSDVTGEPVGVAAGGLVVVESGDQGSSVLVLVDLDSGARTRLAGSDAFISAGVSGDGHIVAVSFGTIDVVPGAAVTVLAAPDGTSYSGVGW